MKNREALESHIAHLEHVLEELSSVVARQDREIADLTRRVALLMRREAEREAEGGGAVPIAGERPPHW
ncbi:SlyX protein [Rhodobacterales bacterium HKCCE3408]|nr:SlyX protein [Rhodobacterales bacterium HKCCE3408]